MIPSPKTAARASAPPEKRFKKPRIPEPLAAFEIDWIALKLTPGTGMLAPS